MPRFVGVDVDDHYEAMEASGFPGREKRLWTDAHRGSTTTWSPTPAGEPSAISLGTRGHACVSRRY